MIYYRETAIHQTHQYKYLGNVFTWTWRRTFRTNTKKQVGGYNFLEKFVHSWHKKQQSTFIPW